MSDHRYKRLTKKEMSETAKAANMSLSAKAKDLLNGGNRPAENMKVALQVGMDVAEALGKKTVKDTYTETAFELIDYCLKPSDSVAKKMSQKAVRDKAHDLYVTVKGEEKRVQVSTEVVKLLSTLDVDTANKVMDLAIELMKSDGRSTIQDRHVRPLFDNLGKCQGLSEELLVLEEVEETTPTEKKTSKKKKKAARRKGKK